MSVLLGRKQNGGFGSSECFSYIRSLVICLKAVVIWGGVLYTLQLLALLHCSGDENGREWSFYRCSTLSIAVRESWSCALYHLCMQGSQ